MESSIPNSSTSSSKSITLNYEMDSSNEDIDQQVLREAGEQTISAEWSATVSALNSLDTTSSNSYINIETLKSCCANPSDTLKDKEDFMIFESSSAVNTSKFNANDTKYNLECKTTAFQKKPKLISQNFSRVFENVLNDDSQMEITQNSICLNRFQKRKRLIPSNDEDFIEINNSNYSGLDNVEISMMKSPKFCFSKKKKKEKFDMPDYNLSATESVSIADDTNISKIKENISNLPLVVNDNSNNIMEVSKAEVLIQKFSRKTIGVPDTAFDNIINDSSLISDIAPNNKTTSLNEISVSNINSTPMFSKTSMSNLNYTYDVPINTNYSTVKNSISGDVDVSRVKQNIVFKKPLNSSILINDSSNNMDASNTEIFIHKFNRKKIDITNSAFDNILNDSSMTFDIRMNNKNTSLNENSVSNVNSTPMFSKASVPNLNYTYDVLINTDSTTVKESIADDADISKVKQNTDFKIPSNLSLVNDNSNNMDVSNTEIFINKFGRKTIDVADSVFENIINDSNITSDNLLNNKDTSSNKILVTNVYDTPGFSKINISNLNHTYDKPINIDSSKIDVSITADNKIVKVKQNAGFKKSSTFVNDSSDNIMDLSKTEVFTHKFSRKTIDVTNSVFDNIINDSSMISDNTLNNKKSLIQTPVLNIDSTPVFNKMDSSNLNHYSNKSQKTQSKESIISTSSNEDLSLTNSSTGFLERRSSSRSKSKSSKHSTSAISNNDALTLLNTTMESLESNESQKLLSEHSISPTNNESLKSTNSTTGFSERRSSSRNKSKSSKHSTSAISNNDALTLLNTTMESLESNESQKSLSERSISPSTNNESLKSTNSTTGFSERRSSSRNKSKSSKHSTSAISNNDALTLLNTTMESLESNESQKSLSERSISPSTNNESLKSTNSTIGFSERRSSSRNKSKSSKHSTSAISNNDALTLLNTTMESLGSNESQKSLLKRSISSTNNKSLKSTNSTTGFSERRSSSRNKSKLSKHSTSAISNNDSLTSLNTTMESLGSNESQKSQSKRSISPSTNNESFKSTNSTTEISKRCSSSRNKSSLLTSKHSTSVISNKDSTALLNSTTGFSERCSSRNQSTSSKHSTSAISNNDNLTSLNTSMESLESNESQKSQSKRSISPSTNNESLKSTNSTTEISKRRSSSRNKSSLLTSKHSTSVISNKDSTALLNSTTGFSERCSSRNQSTSSKHSTSAISNNDSLTSLNTTMESLESNESQKSQLKRSISPTNNESLKSTNSTTGFLERRSSSRNKSSLLTSKHSTSVISSKDSTALLNSTTGISVNDKSAKNKSQHCTSVISKNDNLTLLNATIESVENYNAQKIQSKHLKSPTFNTETSTTLNTTTGSLKQNILEQKSNGLSNVEPVTSIDIDKLTNTDCLTIKDTTTLEQKVMSINQSNSSPNSSIKMSINRLEDDPNYNNKIHSLLSKQENHSHDNIEQVIPNITDGSLVENKSSKTRVLRSSLRNNKNKSLFTKSLASKNINNLCTGSARSSKNVVNFENESFNNNSDNSLFWTTLPDETTSISSTHNVNVNTFQTPISNKLIIAENIVNTIKIMSTNKQKSTHPGAFVLDDHNNGPLTRSFVTRSCNHSPSILTLAFGGQQISESTSSLTHSLSETIIDQSQIEENIKQKFKSLYKKESWITKRLYKFLIIKLQPNYNIYSVKYAEKFIKYLAMLLKQIYNDNVNLQLYTDMLRYHMARYGIIKDTFDYLGFLSDYIPMAYYKKLVPGWNLEISAVKFDPQKYYIPLMDDEEFLNYIMKHLKEA
ncbi:MATH and LRR domain-containing protein PFE0570w-like [Aphis gossypii]|uniref:MATH and LRR domain-containing protein PFE0570w-like n=1 Tax=Aphis gossypii TaxID=80765 RepID=UPI00215941BD|nr:MATH and LRR domain-containing protein PFE0570w-like [Aphis gossypii]